MLVTRALEYKEHVRGLDELPKYLTPVIYTADSHMNLARMQSHLANHLGIATNGHYQPHDRETGIGPFYVATAKSRISKAKLSEARLFCYAYQTGAEESFLN